MSTAGPDSQLLSALIGRVVEKLPVNSGLTPQFLETDIVFRQNITSILDVAPYKIQEIIAHIIPALEKLESIETSQSNTSSLNADGSSLLVNVLYSCLVLNRLISHCFAQCWRNGKVGSHSKGISSKTTKSSSANTSTARSSMASFPRAMSVSKMIKPSGISFSIGTTSSTSSQLSSSSLHMWSDPPSLDETVASYMSLHSIRLYMNAIFANVTVDTINHSHTVPSKTTGISLPETYSHARFFRFFLSQERVTDDLLASVVSIPNMTPSSLWAELERATGQIIYYLSASNWNLMFTILFNKLQYLKTVSNSAASSLLQGSMEQLSSGEDGVYDFMIMQSFHLNRMKLSSVIKKIVAGIKQFNKKGLICLCVSLKRAIWSWIEAYPLEFSNLNQERRNLEGQPEVIFDHIFTVSESSKKKHLYWPTLVSLLLLSAEDLFTYTTTGGGTSSFGKKGPFLDHLRKLLKSKNSEVALYCYIEICKAGTFVNKKDSAALRILISGFETEIKEKLFDPLKPLTLSAEEGLLDEQIFVESIASFFKLNPLNTIRSVYPSLLSQTSPSIFKLAFIKSCTILVTEETNLPWNPPIDSSLADHIRTLFLESVGREKASAVRKASLGRILNEKDKKAKKIGVEEAERCQIILNCLFDWSACPPLVVAREQSTIQEGELKSVLGGICHCLFETVSEIRYFAGRVLLRVLGSDFIPRWDGTVPDWNGSTDTARPTEESLKTFWKISSYILLSISRSLLEILSSDIQSDVKIISEIVTLCGQLLHSRNGYLQRASKFLPAVTGSNANERYLASVSMEVCFLILLSSTETELSKEAVSCLHRLVQEADITGESAAVNRYLTKGDSSRAIRYAKSRSLVFSDDPINLRALKTSSSQASSPASSTLHLDEPIASKPHEFQSFSVVDNIPIYRELYNLIYGSVGSSIMSNKGLQKHIRRLLRTANRTTLGNMAAWEEVYRKWKNQYCVALRFAGVGTGASDGDEDEKGGNKKYGRGVVKSQSQNESVTGMGDEQAEWYNYTGLLCALGHICLGANPAQIRNGKVESVYGTLPGRSASMESDTSTLDQVLSHNISLQESGGSGFQTAMRQQIANSFGSAKQIVDRFIWELGEFLLHDSVVIRESVKELFGCELSPILYNNLFNFFDKALLSILSNSQSEICTDRNNLFIDHVTTILKLVLDRADELYAKQPVQGEISIRQGSITQLAPFALDFGSLIMHIVQYLIYLTAIPSQAPTAVKAKIRLCNVLHVLLQKKSLVGIKNDVAFQNYMIEVLLEWNSEFHTKASDSQVLSIDPSGKPQNELDLLTMKVMASLLQNLPLRLVSGTNGQLEMQESSVETRAKIFSKFLSFFLKILHAVKVADNFENVRSVGTSTNTEFRQFLAKSKEALAHLSRLKDYTITAMANVIAANVDIGLKYSLSLAYHDDMRTRATFLQVLAGILHESVGAKEPATLGGEEDSKHSLYTKFLDLICDESLLIVRGICDFVSQSDVDEVANLLFPIFQSRGKSHLLLSRVLEEEIQKTDTEANLFRRNSLATKLLTLYASSEGQSFLVSCLGPILDSLCHSDRDVCYEIDPSKLQPGESLEQNLMMLKRVTQSFIDSIINARDLFPKNLRAVCATIFELTKFKFPGSELNGVGGFVFLRFICPSIVSPESHGLVKRGLLGRDARRCLILVTKVIQNLANNVLFGNKEAFMVEMNSVVQGNESRIHSFLKELSVYEMKPSDHRLCETGIVGSDADVLKLHRFIESSLLKLEKTMTIPLQGSIDSPHKTLKSPVDGHGRKLLRGNIESATRDQTAGEMSPISDLFTMKKKAFDELSLILVHLGPVATAEEIAKAARRKSLQRITDSQHASILITDSTSRAPVSRHFVEFMKKYDLVATKSREIEKLKEMDVIYQAGTDTENHPVLVFACHRLKPEHIDPTMFLYYAFTKFGALLSSPFGLIVDLTLFGPSNEWSLESILELEKIFPGDGKNNMKYLIFMYPNHAFKQHAKKASRILHPKFFRNILFVSSTAELREFMQLDQILLPKLALSVSETTAQRFAGLILNNTMRNASSVSISVSSHTFQIIQEKKQDLLGWQVTLVDTFHLTDIVDVGPQMNIKSGTDMDFFIKISEGDHEVNGELSGSRGPIKSYVFTSDKRDLILQTIRSAIARFQLSKPAILSDKDVYLSPRDHPETILNIAFLNMGTDDPNLRVVSFNLLSSALSSFGYLNGEFFLENAKGLAIPMNNFRFVRTISSKLAETEKALTLDLVYECVQGFSKYDRDLKHHAIQYLAPWIPNLASLIESHSDSLTSDHDKKNKLHQVVQSLLNLTLKEKDVFFEIQELIWGPLSRCDQSVSVVIDIIIDSAREYSLASHEHEIIGSTLITMASANIAAVAGKLLNRIRLTLESKADTPVSSVVDMPYWKDVMILLRLTMLLSFDNRLNIAHYLPDLFFLLSLLVGVGPPVIRRTIYAIVVNVVQSFSIAASRHETRVSGLQLVLARLMDPRFNKLFAISSTNQSATSDKGREMGSQAFNLSSEAVMGDVVKDVPLADLEAFINILLDIMSYASSTAENLCIWKTRWVSLSAKSAFETNRILQSRSFLCLGCLSKDSFDGELLYQCLVALKTSLLRLDDSTLTLTLSIITCICHVIAGIPSLEGYISMVFWLSISLLQISNEAIYLKSLNLMLVALDLIEKEPRLRGSILTNVLLQGREPFSGNAVKLDQQMHVVFKEEYFGFAVTAVLLQGLHHPSTRKLTYRVLMRLLELNCQSSTDQVWWLGDLETCKTIWGYLLPLIPTSENLEEIITASRITSESSEETLSSTFSDTSGQGRMINNFLDTLFSLFPFEDTSLGVVCMIMLQNLLINTDSEAESLIIYKMYAKFADKTPHAFSLIYPSLAQNFSNVISSSKTSYASESVHEIFKLLASRFRQDKIENHRDILDRAGFTGLLAIRQFADVSKESKSKRGLFVCDIIELILSSLF